MYTNDLVFKFTPNKRSCDEYQLLFNMDEVVHFQHFIDDSTLIITNISKSSSPHANNFAHLGTFIFNNSLLDIEYRRKIHLKSIRGTLSSADQMNNNWFSSIPFYHNFSYYLDKDLPYTCRFHLFENENLQKEIPIPGLDLHLFIQQLIDKYNKKDLFFAYSLAQK